MTETEQRQKKPLLIEVAEDIDPASAPDFPVELPAGQAMQHAAIIGTRPPSRLWRFAVWAIGAFLSFAISVAAWDFITGLFVRNAVLGWLGFGLLVAALAALGLMALREGLAYARMARMDRMRAEAGKALTTADLPLARQVVGRLTRLYDGRADAAWGRARMAEREAEVFDADALISLAERELMTPLDARAKAEVEAAARQVAMVTALVPLALADVAAALFANIRMIRKIAEVYGGRAGTLGSWSLLRRVFGHLLATGALALTDDLIGSVAGGGVLAKVSRRFGEGVVNGALTARVGLAAIEMCRPLPFHALEKPSTSAIVSRALAGFLKRD